MGVKSAWQSAGAPVVWEEDVSSLARAGVLSAERPRQMLMQELIGWGSALVLLPTFGVQTYRQWESRHEHVSSTSLWFFSLALVGTLGQFVYSWMAATGCTSPSTAAWS